MLHDYHKKIRYAFSFAKRRIVHTNLQILYDCNFQCTICDFWKGHFQAIPHLAADDVHVIAEKLDTIGPQIISIGGGEPLLHPELVDIVQILAKKHFPVMICNGWYVTPETAKQLFQAGIYEISISVDYSDPERHDRQRGKKGAFERAVRALQILHENRVHPYQRVHMISVLMDDNLDDIEQLIQMCRNMGITYLLTLYSDCRGSKENKIPNRGRNVSEDLLRLKKKYREFVALRGYLASFSEALARGGIEPCHAGKNLCNIDSQGNVALCIDRLDTAVGNILQEDMKSLEKKLLNLQKSNPCYQCWTSCRGSIETLMYGRNTIANLKDYLQMTKAVH